MNINSEGKLEIDVEDLFEASGVKLNLTIPSFEPGVGIALEMNGMVTTFLNEDLKRKAGNSFK